MDSAPSGSPRGPRALMWDGATTVAPMLLGVVPFGMVAGLAATEIGLRPVDASAFSLIVFAGAAQLAAIDLLGAGANLAVVIGSALVINLRFIMYSASIAPHFEEQPRRRQMLASYLLTSQAYAVSIVRFQRPDLGANGKYFYYLGAGLAMWSTWQSMTIAGIFVGAAVPDWIPLSFAVPLAFLALLLPATTDRPSLVAAITAAAVAVAAAPLPGNLGMPTAATCGVLAGWLLSRRTS